MDVLEDDPFLFGMAYFSGAFAVKLPGGYFLCFRRWRLKRCTSFPQPMCFWGAGHTVDGSKIPTAHHLGFLEKPCKNRKNIWVFPKTVVPRKSSIFLWWFSMIFTVHFGIPLFLETPIYQPQLVIAKCWTGIRMQMVLELWVCRSWYKAFYRWVAP